MTAPAYGSLTTHEELALLGRDRIAWTAYVAQNMAVRIVTWTDEQIRCTWPRMGTDYKAAVWKLLDLAGRKKLRAALDGKAAELEKVPA